MFCHHEKSIVSKVAGGDHYVLEGELLFVITVRSEIKSWKKQF